MKRRFEDPSKLRFSADDSAANPGFRHLDEDGRANATPVSGRQESPENLVNRFC